MKKVCFLDDLKSHGLYRNAKIDNGANSNLDSTKTRSLPRSAAISQSQYLGRKNPQNITKLENDLLQKRNVELEQIVKVTDAVF